ncbi:hypothetical protein POPTR_016G139750v4 [Populus trichocarpa]|uniref:Uncharacterized protein n=1 Tax=Populus trichocarpa TaxID=3694 RepID=A0ACC0RVS9_POPTR|nr:hypothetical protein BDE02_16G125300 [Populus trichocarpa]KAI9380695.1 hypothetical protein POPTR_016G139750v4 [Populus trichocarpa]
MFDEMPQRTRPSNYQLSLSSDHQGGSSRAKNGFLQIELRDCAFCLAYDSDGTGVLSGDDVDSYGIRKYA